MSITALDALSHLDGTDVKPAEPKFSTTYKAAWMNDDQKLDETYQTDFKNWSYVKNITKAHIATQISDSLLIQVYNSEKVTKMWKTICDEYEGKTCMVSIDIHRHMMALRAEDGDDIQVHLDSMHHMYKQLAGMNAIPSKDDYMTIILDSLPMTYSNHLFSLSATAQLNNKPLTHMT